MANKVNKSTVKVKLLKGIPSLAYFVGDVFEMDAEKAKKYADAKRVEIINTKVEEDKK